MTVVPIGVGQAAGWPQALERLRPVAPDFATLLLTFTLAIFVALVFGVRLLLVARKMPVPADPLDMAKPRPFRTMMLGSAVLLTPPVVWQFLPVEGVETRWAVAAAYMVDLAMAVVLWLALELYYQVRARRRRG